MSGIKINIGSGYKKIDGFLNLDNDPIVNPDHRVDLENANFDFLADNSVDEVIASHILEHIGTGYIKLMKEIYRVCCDGAVIHITFPHHRSDWYADDPTHVRPLTANSFKLFSKKYINYHIENYGSSNGMAIKENIDFEIIEEQARAFPKWEERFKTMRPEEIQEVIDSMYNVFYEVHVKLVVIKE